jgi:hypothetical protein
MANPYKILSAPADAIEAQVNEASEKYVALVWGITPGVDGAVVTVVMIDKRELPRPSAPLMFPGPGKPPGWQ